MNGVFCGGRIALSVWGAINVESRRVLHDGEAVELTTEDIVIETVEAEDKAVAEDGDVLVGLNLEITESLQQEGVAREFIRHVQNARKDQDFDIMDKVKVLYNTGSEGTINSVEAFLSYICNETLATTLTLDATLDNGAAVTIASDEVRISIVKDDA